jgi:hypothetical protein
MMHRPATPRRSRGAARAALAGVLGLAAGACSGRPLVASPPDAAAPATRAAADADVTEAQASDAFDAVAETFVALPPVVAPTFPVGYDAFRAWDLWPVLRVGTRTYMRSTYDRSGGNEGADASHFLRREPDGTFVTLDVEGQGLLSFVRTNHWHGSPWHYVIDGHDDVVQESSTADPEHPVTGSTFLPAAAFPAPLALTWSTTQGADLSWISIGFTHSLRLGYERTHYGTGYYIYQLFAAGAPVSTAPTAWSADLQPPADVLALLARAGEDLAPQGDGVDATAGQVDVPAAADARVLVADLAGGPTAVRALRFEVPAASAVAFGRARLRITWDERATPSVDVPVALFFGAGTLYNRDGREHLVKALPVSIRFAAGTATLSTYFPMPFRRHARVELVSTGEAVAGVAWQLRTTPWDLPAAHAGYFHVTYRDHPAPVRGDDLVLLDTEREEGGGPWCGHFVGTSFVFSERAELSTLEGDPRFFFDDSLTPQAQGTGTEEWGGGGDYWGGTTMTLPLAGHPTGAPSPLDMKELEDGIESAYRFLLPDAFPFGRNARIQLEHGGLDDSVEHYRTAAFWYGLPGACLERTDRFHVGDLADEQAHAYVSPRASAVESITSRYEWGVDHLDGREIFPATTDFGRHTTGPTELTLAIAPDNLGVLLRRKLDYAIADQRAEVWISDADGPPSFERAGMWYLAGSNRCLHSNPGGELAPAEPILQISNRRFRDDEFMLPAALTRGRSHLRVRIVPMGHGRPPLADAPDEPFRGAWSELRYEAYVWRLPPAP